MADHSVGARDECHESEASWALMFCFDNVSPRKRVSTGLTVRRKTAKNLAVRRKNERILAVSRKKN